MGNTVERCDTAVAIGTALALVPHPGDTPDVESPK